MPKKRVDFKDLVQRIPIERVVDMLGLNLKKAGAQLRGPCPICDNGSDRCFVVTPSLNRYWCFGTCKSGGDIIELVAQVKRIPKKDAAHLIAEELD